jgi:hypothetical protein
VKNEEKPGRSVSGDGAAPSATGRLAIKKSKALVPAGPVPQVGEIVFTSDQQYYRSLNDDELLDALRQSLSTLQSASVRITQEVRQHLLPALRVLRERYKQPGRRKPIPGRPTYSQVLQSLNLKPDTVRRWFSRTVSADAVLELLGERPKRKRPSHRSVEESTAQILLAFSDRIVAALLKGEIELAKRLAREYSEERNF